MGSPHRDADGAIPPPPHGSLEKPAPPAAILNRASRDELAVMTKVEKGGRGAGGDGTGAGARGAERGSRVVSWIVRRERRAAAMRRAVVGVRVSAAVLCLIAFSVMAADTHKGWALDSFDRYAEYRYCLSVNVIGFVYSGFQVYAQVHHTMSGKYIIQRPIGYYADFTMDQIMAYLLMSASSSAASRIDFWVSNWGTDPFPSMASGSVAMSFMAFVAFALCSLVSVYHLFTWNL